MIRASAICRFVNGLDDAGDRVVLERQLDRGRIDDRSICRVIAKLTQSAGGAGMGP